MKRTRNDPRMARDYQAPIPEPCVPCRMLDPLVRAGVHERLHTGKVIHWSNGGPYMMGGADVYDPCPGHEPTDLVAIFDCKHRGRSTAGLPELERHIIDAERSYRAELETPHA